MAAARVASGRREAAGTGWPRFLPLLLAVVATCGAIRAGTSDAQEPRTLVLALDGVPYRTVERARELGAFDGWPETRRLISTFPSMTNVGFIAILQPLGTEPMKGYELRHFDPERKRVRGGRPWGYRRQAGTWRRHFDLQRRGLWAKAGQYLRPKRTALKEVRRVERLVLDEPADLMLALVSATDALIHFRGDDAIVQVLLEVSERVEGWRREHRRRHGRELRVVLLSDHGNTAEPVRTPGGIRRALRRAGLRPSKRLRRPNDVVPVTYGVCGYGTLYLEPSRAETAATALLGHPAVELAAWVTGEGELRVVSQEGGAFVRWRDGPGGRRLAYAQDDGDPLELGAIVATMEADGLLDGDGYGLGRTWLERTALHRLPDAPARLVDALDGAYVENAATVIFSLGAGYAWGLGTAQAGAWLLGGGRLAATHGGLDGESTWGFLLGSEPSSAAGPAVRAEEALRDWVRPDAGLSVLVLDAGAGHDALHRARGGRP